ncbi:uncharacterized protein A1O9_02992 [Exophiala aquamarina CBS 119918]|uniref:HSA domain-containing protein n=1 Tax=Exophiala aquamarina CBS 119918 TaxID=1182545 RepID=A0A072PNG2_9EURO|nr:uncharacterized protein A1O9_02992 [Exophiala aquamarina CBS 119918]KEF61426.1 hypothetical protein A1O9_02992 [Exophiala aquamarina CBS 119918]
MAPLTPAMRLDHARNGKAPQRRRPPPVEIKKTVPIPKTDEQRSRHVTSLGRSDSPINDTHAIFPYHIDEENEIIYKRANDGTWTQGVPSAAEREDDNPGKLVRWAEVPQTLEFNYDWTMTKIAAECRDVDLRRVVNHLMRVRTAHDIAEYPIRIAPVLDFDLPEEPKPVYGAEAILNADGSYAILVNWDYLLRDIKDTSRLMQDRRRWNMQGMRKVARWCAWGRSQLIENRTAFVEDIDRGYVIEKGLDGLFLSQVRLGYRREEDCYWGNVTGPWDPESRTEHDKSVTAGREDCAGRMAEASYHKNGQRSSGKGNQHCGTSTASSSS